MSFELSQDNTSNLSQKYLSFLLRGQLYAVPVQTVVEINQMSKITRIPKSPDFVMGVLNLRGKIIPIIDLGMRLAEAPSEATRQTCVVVMESNTGIQGSIVDSVCEVIEIKQEDIEMSPEIGKGETAEFITGIAKIEDEIIILLALDKIIDAQKLLESDLNTEEKAS